MIDLYKAKQRFLAFRGGSAFFGALAMFLALWFAARLVWHFDPDNAWLNLLLSLEASVTTSLLLDLQVKTTTSDRQTFARILALEERIDRAIEGDNASL